MADISATPVSRTRVIAAFAAVYTIWGSTYLAIRVGVETLPPFLMAGVRFAVAGSILYVLARSRGAKAPQRIHWRSATVVGGLLLCAGNGGVTFAEQWVPSGVTALLVSTVPLWMVLANWARRGGVRPGAVEALGIMMGFGGVAILVDPSSFAGAAQAYQLGVFVLLGAAFCWALGSIYSRHATLPDSPLLTTGMQMLAGSAILFAVSFVSMEWKTFEIAQVSTRSLVALAYLIVFGAIVGYTAYVWLLRVSTPARVSTYAYVNPVVAVMLGAAILDEPLTSRTFVAMGVILAGVVLITARATRASANAKRSTSGGSGHSNGLVNKEASRLASTIRHPVIANKMHAHELADLLKKQQEAGAPYHEFLRKESLSVGVYVLPAGGADDQTPHGEDEVYYVVAGRATIRVGDEDRPVKSGTIVFVEATEEHRFHSIEEELTVLVFFAPAECSGEAPAPSPVDAISHN